MSSSQLRSDLLPADMSLRKAVQQERRRTGTTSDDEVARLPNDAAPILEPQQ